MQPENVQDYPRPPAMERTPQRLRVMLAGAGQTILVIDKSLAELR